MLFQHSRQNPRRFLKRLSAHNAILFFPSDSDVAYTALFVNGPESELLSTDFKSKTKASIGPHPSRRPLHPQP